MQALTVLTVQFLYQIAIVLFHTQVLSISLL